MSPDQLARLEVRNREDPDGLVDSRICIATS